MSSQDGVGLGVQSLVSMQLAILGLYAPHHSGEHQQRRRRSLHGGGGSGASTASSAQSSLSRTGMDAFPPAAEDAAAGEGEQAGAEPEGVAAAAGNAAGNAHGGANLADQGFAIGNGGGEAGAAQREQLRHAEVSNLAASCRLPQLPWNDACSCSRVAVDALSPSVSVRCCVPAVHLLPGILGALNLVSLPRHVFFRIV